MVLPEFGGEFQLEERDIPAPGHGEVLVRVDAVGIRGDE
jgi:NADPH:quinone reductase-like Zn-dependent oxidoreductase